MTSRVLRRPFGVFIAVVLAVLGSIVFAQSAHASQALCGSYGSTPSFNCVASTGFSGQRPWGYPVDANGHNCTNYVTFRLWQNGVTNPGNLGNAHQWDNSATAYGIPVNNTPTVGSVAVWEINSGPALGSGHVAYVEAVTSGYIDVSEDNYGGTTMRHRYFTGLSGWPNHFIHFKDITPPTAPSDRDSDGSPDTVDLLPLLAGPTNNRGVPLQPTRSTGDFNGDGKQDAMEIYDYGNARTKFMIHYGDGMGGFMWPQVAWDSGPGNWEWQRIKSVVGDFNSDGKSDVGVFYDYGNAQVKLYVLDGTASGLAAPSIRWDSGTGMWEWNRIVPLVGDFNGDGKADIVHVYDYGNAQTKFLIFNGDGVGGFAWPQVAWDSGPGNWQWQLLKHVVGDFNKDGKSDVAVFYDYGNNRVVLWELLGSANGLSVGGIKWDSGTGMWEWNKFIPLVGDFNGDSNLDIVEIYDYGNAQTKFLIHYGNVTGGFAWPAVGWDSGPGNWQWQLLKPVTGKLDGDNKADIAVFYDYGNAQVKLWEMLGASSGFTVGGIKWDSGTGMWEWYRILLP